MNEHLKNTTIPKNEVPMVAYFNEKHEHLFELTKQVSTGAYVLYKVVNNVLQKLGRSDNPSELEARFKVEQTLKESD